MFIQVTLIVGYFPPYIYYELLTIFRDMIYVTGPVKINHVSAKKLPIVLSLQYHNLQTNCTNTIKPLSLLQNLMGFLLKLTEMEYYI